MNYFNIEWNQYQGTELPPFWYADVLGYYVKVFPIVRRTPEKAPRYGATHDEAGESWPIGSGDGYSNVDEAKAAVDTWLASRVRALRAGVGPQLRSGAPFELTVGLGYALKFLDALRTRLTENDLVEVMPAASADGHTGLYFCNHVTGYGVRILSCSRNEYVAMSTGTLSELDEAREGDDRTSTTYFRETEIASYAGVAAHMYLSDSHDTAGRVHPQGLEPEPIGQLECAPKKNLQIALEA